MGHDGFHGSHRGRTNRQRCVAAILAIARDATQRYHRIQAVTGKGAPYALTIMEYGDFPGITYPILPRATLKNR